MPESQSNIYFLQTQSRDAGIASPYYEAFKEKGIEVLFMIHPAAPRRGAPRVPCRCRNLVLPVLACRWAGHCSPGAGLRRMLVAVLPLMSCTGRICRGTVWSGRVK